MEKPDKEITIADIHELEVGDYAWDHHKGLPPEFTESRPYNCTVLVCGPDIALKLIQEALQKKRERTDKRVGQYMNKVAVLIAKEGNGFNDYATLAFCMDGQWGGIVSANIT